MPAAAELIASGKTELEVQEAIGADWLIYQNLEDLISAASEGNPEISAFECSVFNGEYVTGDVDEIYLRRLETKRNDHAKLSKAEKKAGKGNDSGAQIADINNDI
jgi:amidophosphoribosyltransferase